MYATPDGHESHTAHRRVEAASTNGNFHVPKVGHAPLAIFQLRRGSRTLRPGKFPPVPVPTRRRHSPDGKYLAWRSQARAGFEADKWRLVVQDRQTGEPKDITKESDRSVGSFVWDPGVDAEARDGALEFTAEFRGGAPIYRIHLDGKVGRTPSFAGVPDINAEIHADDLVWSSDFVLC
jgi:hypothetical protein